MLLAIQREEEKVKRSLKDAAHKGDRDVCKILAKEIVRAKKACGKLHTSKAHLNSVSLQMKNQLATIKVAGSVAKSTEVMQAMQSLVRVPEVAATMREMSKEMMKAGIIEEMLDETMDSIEDSEEVEEAADEEVDKVNKPFLYMKSCFLFVKNVNKHENVNKTFKQYQIYLNKLPKVNKHQTVNIKLGQ